jgi:hypothetical protein
MPIVSRALNVTAANRAEDLGEPMMRMP